MSKDSIKKRDEVVSLWYSFNEVTTFHGLRYIFSREPGIFRRVFWIILVLFCTIAACYEIGQRIKYFYSWPKNVNSEIEYVRPMEFPAVTICNQNAFKISEVAQRGQIEMMQDALSRAYSGEAIIEIPNIMEFTNITLEKISVEFAHRKEDMIVSCQMNNRYCDANNFTSVKTDHGVCHTFNGRDSSGHAWIYSPGSHHGLELVVNVEQYEYMMGGNSGGGGGGIKVMLHNPDEFPLPGELGYAIPTGTHGFMDLRISKVENLAPPYGQCRNKVLTFFSDYIYTVSVCRLDYLMHYVVNRCGCRDTYMPDYKGKWPSCSLPRYLSCILPAYRDFYMSEDREFDCPIPCQHTKYEPTFSYGSFTKSSLQYMRNEVNIDIVQQRYRQALSTTLKYHEDYSKLENLTESVIQKRKDLLSQIFHTDMAFSILQEKMEEEKQSISYNLTGRESKSKNKTRQWKKSLDRLRSQCIQIKQEFLYPLSSSLYSVQRRVHTVIQANATSLDKESRKLMHIFANSSLHTQLDLVNRAEKEMFGIANFNFNEYHEIDMNNKVLKAYQPIAENLHSIRNVIKRYIVIIEASFANKTLNVSEIEEMKNLTMDANMFFVQSVIKFEELLNSHKMEYIPEKKVYRSAKQEKDLFDSAYNQLKLSIEANEREVDQLSQILSTLDEVGSNVDGDILQRLDSIINSDEARNVEEVLTNMETDSFENELNTVQAYYTSDLHWDKWNSEKSQSLLRELDNMRRIASTMKESTTMDASFYRENFIRLNIYLTELSYHLIIQQPAYDVFALLCDIGGSLGLFVGASVMSMFEILDLCCMIGKMYVFRSQQFPQKLNQNDDYS